MLAVMLVVRVVGGPDEYSETESGELLTPRSRLAWAGPGPSMRGSRAWRRQTQAGTPVCHNKVLLSDGQYGNVM